MTNVLSHKTLLLCISRLGIDGGTNNTFPYNHALVYAFSATGL